MELQKLLEKTVEYVRGRWNAKAPTYEEDPAYLSLPPAAREELRELFPKIKKGIEFEELVQGAQRMTDIEEVAKLNKNIQNNPQTQVIEFCSDTGIRFAYGFAKKHPQTNVILVDKLDPDAISHAMYKNSLMSFLKAQGLPDSRINEIAFQQGFERYDKEVPLTGDVPDFMQRLFQANNVPNMKYAHRWLEENTDLTDMISTKKTTYAVGWKCPANAAIRTIKKAAEMGAEAIAIAPSGMEYIKPIASRQSKEPKIQGWDGVMRMAEATETHHPVTKPMYNYDKPEERKLGFALKHARVLDMMLWLKEQGYNTRLILLDIKEKSYNSPEHIVYAFKQHDILK